MRAFESAVAEPWAMTEEYCRLVLEISSRENSVSPEALEAYRANSAPNAERMGVRDGIAILTIRGPTFKYANLFTQVSGATSYGILRRDLQVALDDSSVHSILLNIDSPGGQANGVSELAQAIRDADSRKPVFAYVGGQGASAAYWLASAAREIVIDKTADVGSIGVRIAVTDTRDRDARSGVKSIEFVSSQSPGKRADLDSDEWRASMQRRADELAAVFIESVAEFRGVSPEHVTQNYGAGGTLIGESAVVAGMADRIGSFEGVVASILRDRKPHQVNLQRNISMTDTNPAATSAADEGTREATLEAARREAATAALSRVKNILALAETAGREELANSIAFNTDLSVEQAKALLSAAPKAQAQEQRQAATFSEQHPEAAGVPPVSSSGQDDPKVVRINTSAIYAKRAAALTRAVEVR